MVNFVSKATCTRSGGTLSPRDSQAVLTTENRYFGTSSGKSVLAFSYLEKGQPPLHLQFGERCAIRCYVPPVKLSSTLNSEGKSGGPPNDDPNLHSDHLRIICLFFSRVRHDLGLEWWNGGKVNLKSRGLLMITSDSS